MMQLVEDECCTRTYDVASCTGMLQAVLECSELQCDANCCCMGLSVMLWWWLVSADVCCVSVIGEHMMLHVGL